MKYLWWWFWIDWGRPLTLASPEQTPVPGHPSTNLLTQPF